MHKKIILILALMVLICAPAFCADTSAFKYSVGLDNPFFGFLQRNSSGQVQSDLGVSLGLGIAYKRYFDSLKFNSDFDPAKIEKFSFFWAIGTYALVLPYAGIGFDYAWNNGFYLGAGLVVSSAIRYVGPGYVGYVGPEIHGGLMF
jgi:hypothetical protein